MAKNRRKIGARQMRPALAAARILMQRTLDILISEVEVIGGKPAGQRIEVQQHVSYLDPLTTLAHLYNNGGKLPYIAAGSNLMTGLMGWLANNMGTIPVDRKRIEGGDSGYTLSTSRIPARILERGESFMYYPGATRTRTGHPEFGINSGGLTIFMPAIRKFAREKKTDLEMRVSAITYDYNPDIEEFEIEQRRGRQPHGGFVDTMAGYMGTGKVGVWVSVVSGRNGRAPPFGKARIAFTEPFRILDYEGGKLGEEVYRRMRQAVVVTDTALTLSILAGREMTRENLAATLKECQDRIPETGALTDFRKPQEAIDYAEWLLQPRRAINVSGRTYSANHFAAQYYRNNISHHLQNAGIIESR